MSFLAAIFWFKFGIESPRHTLLMGNYDDGFEIMEKLM